MTKTLCRTIIVTIFFVAATAFDSHADKFFEDNDAFFLKYLQQQKFNIDTSASAVVLYECTSYDALWRLHVRKIIKIIKKSGSKYADIDIPLFNSRSEYNASVERVHGTTYNLDGDKIVKQKIDADNIVSEKSRLVNEKKISLPAVREGSIIDYSYDITGVNISKWQIQEEIPKLYSKLELCVSSQINMVTEDKIVPMFIEVDENKKNTIDSLLPYSYTYQGSNEKGLPEQCWVRRNVSAFEDEPYLPCENNYREMMLMYVSSIHTLGDHGILNTWDKINEALLESYSFYRPITTWNQSIKERARELAGDDTSELSVAKKIFKFVRDSISAESMSMFTSKDLSKVLETRSGNSADINLLLITLLRHVGLSCSPVILGTKENATPSAEKAEFIKYNYTICQLRINDEKYYLDAAEKYNPFGRIPPFCLNGYARVIDKNKKDTCGIILTPEMSKEKALYSVTTTNNALADYTLNYKFYFSDAVSIDNRTDWNKDTAEIKKYVLSLVKDLPVEAKLRQYKVLNLNDPEKQLTLDFTVSLTWPDSGPVYLNPYAVKLFETDPFKNPKRKYPVELPATENLTYSVNLKLPDGYTIDETPKSAVIKIDENNQYKNLVAYDKDANTLSIQSRLQTQRLFFPVSEYDMLREFFQKMGNEQQSTVVIKKQN